MIPRVNSQGYSFKGVTDYLMHDKKAETDERVAWTETGNMYTNDIFKAAKVMAWTDMNSQQLKIENGSSTAGRKTETGSVYHYSLSWAHRETPNEEHQREMALATLGHLGLSNNEYYLVAHNDTDHAHVHIVANLTNPETGKRTHIGLDRKALQAWALEYEKEHGIHCENRVLNAQLREKDGARYYTETQKARHGIQVTRAYNASDDGKSFKNALEQEGLQLARGRRFLLAVDDKGNMVNIAKVIDGHSTRDMKKKFEDIDRDALPNVDDLSERIKKENEPFDRDAAEAEQQRKLEDAANVSGRQKAEKQEALEAKRKRIAKQEKSKSFDDYFGKRINKAKERHDIEGSRERLKDAKEEYAKVHGVGSRLFKREQFEEAYDNLQNREKQLDEQMRRFKIDIEAIYKGREWQIKKELEKQGFAEIETLEGKTDQSKETIEAAQQKMEDEGEIIKEAEASPEAAARLGNSVTGKTPRQRKKVGRIKRIAEDFKANEKALEQQAEQERIAKEFEALEKQKLDEELGKEGSEIPEFNSAEERRIWMEFKEIEQENSKDLDQDEGLEI
ncbi:relaxase/mobilization nuclease-like protein [Maribacter spongiicola]|uniref:Relaxase/mobilization nuclease-like protein n=2 Tax=Maribacter spongiicola TaxID=1206753 RepID=A0A4R7K185_9FLAO|nr:relaxase/mobilization nuclease domain-containing protein [Maribacter spongiicola]TDT43653.1 relaxase/mobilization nuclease-like protein [Maribacter spongiicola]